MTNASQWYVQAWNTGRWTWFLIYSQFWRCCSERLRITSCKWDSGVVVAVLGTAQKIRDRGEATETEEGSWRLSFHARGTVRPSVCLCARLSWDLSRLGNNAWDARCKYGFLKELLIFMRSFWTHTILEGVVEIWRSHSLSSWMVSALDNECIGNGEILQSLLQSVKCAFVEWYLNRLCRYNTNVGNFPGIQGVDILNAVEVWNLLSSSIISVIWSHCISIVHAAAHLAKWLTAHKLLKRCLPFGLKCLFAIIVHSRFVLGCLEQQGSHFVWRRYKISICRQGPRTRRTLRGLFGRFRAQGA